LLGGVGLLGSLSFFSHLSLIAVLRQIFSQQFAACAGLSFACCKFCFSTLRLLCRGLGFSTFPSIPQAAILFVSRGTGTTLGFSARLVTFQTSFGLRFAQAPHGFFAFLGIRCGFVLSRASRA